MQKYGPRNTRPAKKPPTNSGIFSKSGAGQKMDPVSRPADVARAYDASMRRNIVGITDKK